MRVLKNKEPVSSSVIIAVSLDTASAEKPECVQAHENFEYYPGPKWQVKQPDGMGSESNGPVSLLT